jgi:hypothetical protein
MANRKPSSAPSVVEFIAALSEPLRSEALALRGIILAATDGIGEAIKWNAPSFHAGEHFATMRLNGKILLQLILHLGAKKSAISRSAIDDPAGLLHWLGPDRASIDFDEPGAVVARASALQAIVRQWVQHVPAKAAG